MPNPFNHDTQDEAALEAHQFWPLVEIQCSEDLKFFLCSMYAPICMPRYPKHLPACKSVCLRAKRGCAPLMRQYGFEWPEKMNCDELPVYGDKTDPKNLCMDPLNGEAPSGPILPAGGFPLPDLGNIDRQNPLGVNVPKRINPIKSLVPILPTFPTGIVQKTMFPQINWGVKKDEGVNVDITKNFANDACKCMCHWPMIPIYENQTMYHNKVQTGGIMNCGRPCQIPFFTDSERHFSYIWINFWSIFCFVSTSVTLMTYLIDMQRFKYPERPIIFLSGCYMMVSLAYIIQFGFGIEEIACDNDMVRYNSQKDYKCITVFLLTYFFGMASSLWWVILALTWFLAAGMKWGNEAIASYSPFFHMAAWLIPTVTSMAALWLDDVDGDSVSGICSVGNQNISNLRLYLLIPFFLYLIIGTMFLVGGFISLFRIRNVIKQQGRTKTDKLEKLMMRIGIYSVLYTVPATIVIACYFYEHNYREQWEKGITCPCSGKKIKPIFPIFMLKYFMNIVVGITSGVWIWSGKTLESWKKCYARWCGNGSKQRCSAGQVLVPTGGMGGVVLQPTASHVIKNGPNQIRVAIAPESIANTVASSTCKTIKSMNYSHMNIQKQIPLSHV